MCRKAENKAIPVWKSKLKEKIPNKVMTGIQMAFVKVFCMVFEKGSVLIEKTYNRNSIEKEFQIKDFAVELKGGRKEIHHVKIDATRANIVSIFVTMVEGIGLGALGIGIPDMVLWVSILLRGVYKTAMKYGFDYETPEEKIFILAILEVPMLTGEEWKSVNAFIDSYIEQEAHIIPSAANMKWHIEKTANAFATDMLVTKFIQGLPSVGMIGGAVNPIYYNKVISYVELKYRKRYMTAKLKKM